jgi:choline dehydrogenase-like flavoprotein
MADTPSADFIVVGSGIIGSLIARQLALASASVSILRAAVRHAWRTVDALLQFNTPQ